MSRSKDQWIEETGGFVLGESANEFQIRQWKIRKIKNRISNGDATDKDVEELSILLGASDEDIT